MTKNKKVPEVGEMWTSPCSFTPRDDGSGQLRPGGTKVDGEWQDGPIKGVETRTVVAVVTIPGYQRRVVYARSFCAEGGAPFGRKVLHMVSLAGFNSWRNASRRRGGVPATLVVKSHIETALEAIRERVAA